MDVVCLGELILDMFASEPGRDFATAASFLPVAGGAPANVAVAVAKLGATSAFIGKVGEDPFGRRLEGVLKGYGVDTRGMRFDPVHRTTLNFMTLPEPNRTEMLFYRNPGADMLLSPDELDDGLIGSASVYQFGSVSLAVEPCRTAALEGARRARAQGALVSFDVNYRPSLWPGEDKARTEILATLKLADIVKLNEGELRLLAGTDNAAEGCAEILLHGPALCVATLGPRGSTWAATATGGTVPAFTVDVVDATGCGDAFMAALLVRLLAAIKGVPGTRRQALEAVGSSAIAAAIRYANAAGALTARSKGVMPALPFARDVEKLL